jgi:hypothetical protein
MSTRLVAIVFVLGLVAVGAAVAGLNRNWSTHANGSMEVPARDTQGQGQAIFHLSKDGTQIEYKLIASNIENVFMAHIHKNVPGVNGPIVVWLYPSTTPNVTEMPGAGRTDGVLIEGTFDAGDIAPTAPFGYDFEDLLADLNGGGAYVNFHTNDGVGDTNTGPGDFPGGEIRGDIN